MTLEKITKLKIGYVFVILLINFVGMVPIKWKFFRANANFLSVLNSFAGGVFLAMAFVHILPESVATYTNEMYKKKGFAEVMNNRRLLDSSSNTTSDTSCV
jgi:zinc transporter ZupT